VEQTKFFHLLPEFKKRFLYGRKTEFYIQKYSKVDLPPKIKAGEVNYFNQHRNILDQDLFIHFEQKPRETDKFIAGSYAISGKFDGDIVKWIAIDADNQEELNNLHNKVIPIYEEYGIDYVFETSRQGRGHLWFLCHCTLNQIEKFMKYVLDKAQVKYDEVYPLWRRRSNCIRIPGGWHYKSQQANPIIYKGEESSDPLFILETFNNLKILTDEDIEKFNLPQIEVKVKRKQKEYKQFTYIPRNLIVEDNLPSVIKCFKSECQAFRKLILGTEKSEFIEKPGAFYHDVGLTLSSASMFNDILTESEDGKKWFENLKENYRSRSAEAHHWGYYSIEKFQDNPYVLIPNCETMENKFSMCEGCPFRNRDGFWNPRQLYNGKQIKKNKIKDVSLVTAEEIQETVFTEIREQIFFSLNNDEKIDLLNSAPMETGKSVNSDRLAMELAAKGKNVLLSVPSGDLALEHAQRIKKRGGTVHLLMSHEAIFQEREKPVVDFECPNKKSIQYLINLGADSAIPKKKFCKDCIFSESCPYPNQYKDSLFPGNQIIIMQHAHFRVPEVMRLLTNNKQFDVLIIDESFIDNLISYIKVTPLEIKIFKESDLKWLKKIINWVEDGGYPSGKIYPPVDDLEILKARFDAATLIWRLREIVSAYNEGLYYDSNTGVDIFYPIPDFPVRVITDATPPLRMIQVVLNNKDIKVFGAGKVLNITEYHPENEIIQVLDSSLSKTSLARDEKFYELLNVVGEKIQSKHKDERGLITAYISHIDETISYLKEKFPDFDIGTSLNNQICVSSMKVGLNSFADRTYQFIMASVYMSSRQIIEKSYQIRMIENYFKRQLGEEEIENPHPSLIKSDIIPVKQRKVHKVEVGGVYEYPDFEVTVPKYFYEDLVYQQNIGTSQQSMRLRFTFDKSNRKKVYIFGNYNFPSLLITKVVLLDEFLSELN